MATWFQDTVRPRIAAQRAGGRRRAVVRDHPGDLHAVRGGAARGAAQLRRGVDRAGRRTLADDRARDPAGRQPRHRRRRGAGPRPRRRRDDDRADGVGQRRHRLGAAFAIRSRTISATIAAELAEVVFGGAHYTVLFFLGTLLFLITFGINTVGRLGDPPHEAAARERDVTASSEAASATRDDRATLAAPDGAPHASSNLFADGALAVASGATLLIVLIILVVILFDVIRNGAPHLSWTFLIAGAARRHDRGRHLPGHLRHGRDGHPDDAGGRAGRRRHRDLPARVRLARVAADARDPHRGRQPGRRAVDRVRPVRPGLLRPVRGRGHRQGVLRRREGATGSRR